jgi:Tfp pilus assembly protein PilF
MNSILYIALINKVGEETSSKALTKKSNVYIDKGLKALEENKVDDAVNEFKSAIKSYKKNYLGYMGMCDALSKSEKKNLIKMKCLNL